MGFFLLSYLFRDCSTTEGNLSLEGSPCHRALQAQPFLGKGTPNPGESTGGGWDTQTRPYTGRLKRVHPLDIWVVEFYDFSSKVHASG